MKSSTVKDIQIIDIPTIIDPDGRGNLSVLENDFLPFEFERVYYLYDIPSQAYRGAHAHKAQSEFLIALSGSFDVVLDDGLEQKRFFLNSPNSGLLIPPGIWRELEHFSSGSVCLVLSSGKFDEGDYIRDFDTFKTNKS